ncbi:MAG: SpoVR family protein [Planctomycetota bacterium]
MVSGPSLSPELLAIAHRAEDAAKDAGLSFFEVVFEMLDAADVNAIAAYGGFPVRYASWRFGMEYERLARGYDWGLSKIYELVVNHDPTIAYLVRSNSLMEQKLVMAHVMGHADFFKNNAWFAPTERHMLERFDDHSRRLQESVDRHGLDRVERFLDRALSLEPLMDPHGPLRRFRAQAHRASQDAPTEGRSLAERNRDSLGALMEGATSGGASAPATDEMPTFDVLRFLCSHADLEPWEREALWIVHAEAEYFLPQRMTKIINEGWASLWHSRLLTGGLLDASEVVEFADCHSGATQTAPGQLNPYKLGLDLFRHAERRGLDVFRLRSIHNDVSFVDEVLDEDFIARSALFVTDPARRGGGAKIGSRDAHEVKQALLRSLAWGGQPRIELIEVHDGAVRDMVLRHDHDGRDLKLDEAGEMLRTIEGLWKGPVHLLTKEGDEARRLTSDGGELRMRDDGTGKPRTPQAQAG